MTDYKKLIIQLSVFYGFDTPEVQLRVWASFLKERLTVEELARACSLYCDDPKNEFFPRPISKLVALVRPQLSDEDAGRDVAARIIGAVRRRGRENWADASNDVGELGVIVVERMGGWRAVCELANIDNLTTLQAQLRDLAKSVATQSRFGMVDRPPQLPSSNSKQIGPKHSAAALISDLANQKTLSGKGVK